MIYSSFNLSYFGFISQKKFFNCQIPVVELHYATHNPEERLWSTNQQEAHHNSLAATFHSHGVL